MNKFRLLLLFIVCFCSTAMSQESSKEKAEDLAKNEFSKTKQKQKATGGVVKEKTRMVESTPVIETNPAFYQGHYVNKDCNYEVEIRSDENNNVIATLTQGEGPEKQLRSVSIHDAFFAASTEGENGKVDFWEGVFINKNTDGTIEFGLGLLLPKAIELTPGLRVTKLFLKKVSP